MRPATRNLEDFPPCRNEKKCIMDKESKKKGWKGGVEAIPTLFSSPSKTEVGRPRGGGLQLMGGKIFQRFVGGRPYRGSVRSFLTKREMRRGHFEGKNRDIGVSILEDRKELKEI